MGKYSQYINASELRERRKSMKLSYRDMSKLMNVKSPATYYNLENGLVEPKISQMLIVASILKVRVGKIFNLKVQENKTLK